MTTEYDTSAKDWLNWVEMKFREYWPDAEKIKAVHNADDEGTTVMITCHHMVFTFECPGCSDDNFSVFFNQADERWLLTIPNYDARELQDKAIIWIKLKFHEYFLDAQEITVTYNDEYEAYEACVKRGDVNWYFVYEVGSDDDWFIFNHVNVGDQPQLPPFSITIPIQPWNE